RQFLVVIGEEEKRAAAGYLLAREQERNLRAEKEEHDRRFERRRIGQCRQALTQRAVADLVVVLQKQNKGGRRQVAARRAALLAAAMARRLSLVGEAFREHARDPRGGIVGIIGVVAVVLAGEQHVERVVAVIVPLRVEIAAEVARRIAVVFEHE